MRGGRVRSTHLFPWEFSGLPVVENREGVGYGPKSARRVLGRPWWVVVSFPQPKFVFSPSS